MDHDSAESVSQFIDRFLQRTAIGVTLLSLANGLGAAGHLVGDRAAALADGAQFVLAVLIVLVVFPVFARLVWLRRRARCDWSESDSYMGQIFGQACVAAFSTAFILLIAFQATAERFFAGLPTAFFLDAVLAGSLAVLAIRFFGLARSDDDEDDDVDRRGDW